MSSINTISLDKLARLIGTPKCPVTHRRPHRRGLRRRPPAVPGLAAPPGTRRRRLGARLRRPGQRSWSASGAEAQRGRRGLAAACRRPAEALEGGFEALAKAGLPLVPVGKLPPRDAQGRTVWVTRARPKIDRIACPWLIRRFVDPHAVFLFVAPSEVAGVAERFAATPFDIEGVFWSHRGELCTFDVMVEEFGLATEPLLRLATIVRGADTGRPRPRAGGGRPARGLARLSRMYRDDLAQLEAGMALYDAFYRWCRDATDETHTWPTAKPPAS